MSKTDIFILEFSLSHLKNVLKQTGNYFNTKFQPQRKDQKSSY